MQPAEGFWSGGKFNFTMSIPKTYPHEAPKVHCNTKVYHPNIDLNGKVCLNILREDWKPTLSITSVVLGLQFLFMDPNPGDPLNKAAADTMKDNEAQFQRNVSTSMRGGRVRLRRPRCPLPAGGNPLPPPPPRARRAHPTSRAHRWLFFAQVDGEHFPRSLVSNKRPYDDY